MENVKQNSKRSYVVLFEHDGVSNWTSVLADGVRDAQEKALDSFRNQNIRILDVWCDSSLCN